MAKVKKFFSVAQIQRFRKALQGKSPSRAIFYWRLAAWGLLLLLIADLGYLTAIWPNWEKYATGPIPKSEFMQVYENDRADDPRLPPVRWYPISYRSIPKEMIRAVIVGEDAKFYKHDGVDVAALKEAIEYNWEKGKVVYGSSTISQQTVKNLFLSSSRNPLRKLHEYLITFSMEKHLSKKRIIELYLNVVEFGPGIYGIEAAAKHYFGVPAIQMSTLQCLELAATLPAPVKHNPETRTRFFKKRLEKLKRQYGYRSIEPAPVVTTSDPTTTPVAPTESATPTIHPDTVDDSAEDENPNAN